MSVQRVLEFDHFFCDSCRSFIYDESAGDEVLHLAPRTRVDDLPISWACPICGASKDKLRAVTLLDEYQLLPEESRPYSNSEVRQLANLTSQNRAADSQRTGCDRHAGD